MSIYDAYGLPGAELDRLAQELGIGREDVNIVAEKLRDEPAADHVGHVQVLYSLSREQAEHVISTVQAARIRHSPTPPPAT